jgi:DNA-binding SARP family transcriptional activator
MEAWTLTGQNVLPSGRKTRALLAVLALMAPRPMLRGRLAELLWSRRPEEQARASLRQEIHRLLDSLRPAGAQVLIVARDHLALRPDAAWVDVEEVLRATAAKPAALSLLDGELLEDLDGTDAAFDAWLIGERERLRDRARAVAEGVLREQTTPDATIAAAQQLLTIDRTHEGAWRALMRAHAARGERGLAIQAFERCRAVLAEALDARPSAETVRLLEELRAAGAQRAQGTGPTDAAAAPHQGTGPEGRKPPRVGVIPLHVIGAGEADAQIGIGLAEEITAALAHSRAMFLVSSAALARLAAQTRDEAALRRTFDLQYLLDGTVQRPQGRLRISLRLLDLRAGSQVVWSHRFDRYGDDLLALQDEIAAETAAQIDAEIPRLEARYVTFPPGLQPAAHDLTLRALTLMERLERSSFMLAGDMLRKAVAEAPDYAPAHAWYAWWHMLLVAQAWMDDPSTAGTRAGELAERAILLDPQDARALTIAGHVRGYLHRRLKDAVALHERALACNPNLALAWALSGLAFIYLGEIDEGERRLRRYRTLTPLDPHGLLFDTAFCTIALLRRDHAAAVLIGRSVTETHPGFPPGFVPYLAALGHLGLADDASVLRLRLLTLDPGFTLRQFARTCPLADAVQRAHYAEGLRLAQVPE